MADDGSTPIPLSIPKIGVGIQDTIADIVRGDREEEDVEFIYESSVIREPGGLHRLCQKFKGNTWKDFYSEAKNLVAKLAGTKIKTRIGIPAIVDGVHWVEKSEDIFWYPYDRSGKLVETTLVRYQRAEPGKSIPIILTPEQFEKMRPRLSKNHPNLRVGDIHH